MYEILGLLGTGGMGEVYRARDTRLGREVALKVLPENFASDIERRRRFEREARLLASLNHPAIVAFQGLEETGGLLCLVMELVEGTTLVTRQKGSFTLSEALDFAHQIAEGLEAAHERGVLHRDLKPSNIKVTPQGRVKLLDFGLAKAMQPAGAGQAALTATATDSTGHGVAPGTAPYMSPEQARGEALDRRTDVWAFGCVLYEMLSGRRAFPGPTHAEATAAVLEREPDWNALPLETPPIVRKLLRRCLEKNKTRRLHDIGDARLEIEEAQCDLSSGVDMHGSRARFQRRRWFRQVLPIVSALAIGFVAAFWTVPRLRLAGASPRGITPTVVARSVIELGPAMSVTGRSVSAPLATRRATFEFDSTLLALSPDGRWLVYVGEEAGLTRLYRRALDRFDGPHPIAGTEGALHAFFSPDSRYVGFLTEQEVKRISIDGDRNSLQTLCATQNAIRGSWTRDGMIFVADEEGRVLRRISGGGVEKLDAPDLLNHSFFFGDAIPDGKAVLLTERASGASADYGVIRLLDIESRSSKVLVRSGYDPRYIAPGYLVFTRAGTLMAVTFDPVRGEVAGDPVPVLRGLSANSNFGQSQIAFSDVGTVAYVPGSDRAAGRLAKVDRQGQVEMLSAPMLRYGQLSLSPDGTRLAVHVADVNDSIWIWDLRESDGDLIAGPLPAAGWPIWSPSGEEIAFASWRPGQMMWCQIPIKRVQEPEEPRVEGQEDIRGVLTGGPFTRVWSWAVGKAANEVLFALSWLGQEHEHWGIRDVREKGVRGDETTCSFGALSRDGRWIACYREGQIHIRPVGVPHEERQVSTNGGIEPRWCSACNLLFFRNGNRVLATAVSFEPNLSWEPPQVAFETDLVDTSGLSYDVSPDGQYLYVVKSAAPEERRKLHLITGWRAELEQRIREEQARVRVERSRPGAPYSPSPPRPGGTYHWSRRKYSPPRPGSTPLVEEKVKTHQRQHPR